jgi:hypothetical protein
MKLNAHIKVDHKCIKVPKMYKLKPYWNQLKLTRVVLKLISSNQCFYDIWLWVFGTNSTSY